MNCSCILFTGLELQEIMHYAAFSFCNGPFSLQMLLAWDGQDCETQRQRAGAGKMCWLMFPTCFIHISFWILHLHVLLNLKAAVSLVNFYPFQPITRFNASELILATKSQKIAFLLLLLKKYQHILFPPPNHAFLKGVHFFLANKQFG